MNARVTQKPPFPFSLSGAVSAYGDPSTREHFPIGSGIFPEIRPIWHLILIKQHSLLGIAVSWSVFDAVFRHSRINFLGLAPATKPVGGPKHFSGSGRVDLRGNEVNAAQHAYRCLNTKDYSIVISQQIALPEASLLPAV
jgi:hypothetical protein